MSSNKTLKNDDIINFVFMGNIGEAQNLECLLKAISLISDRSNFKFHIVGSGSRYERCIELTNSLEVSDSVIFYGRHPKTEMSKFYSMADVCFASLKDEGIVGCTIPGKIQEYMSAGMPILACMNGDTADIIKMAGCGICVPANDENELATAITRVVNLKANLKSMGNNAKKYYKEHFTLTTHVDELEKSLGELIK